MIISLFLYTSIFFCLQPLEPDFFLIMYTQFVKEVNASDLGVSSVRELMKRLSKNGPELAQNLGVVVI